MFTYFIENILELDLNKDFSEKGFVVAENPKDAHYMLLDAYALKWDVQESQLQVLIYKDDEIVLISGYEPEILPDSLLAKFKSK